MSVPTGTVADIPDAELLRRAVCNAARRPSGRIDKRRPAWSRVQDVFALGSTYSMQLCRRFNVDPDSGQRKADRGRGAGAEEIVSKLSDKMDEIEELIEEEVEERVRGIFDEGPTAWIDIEESDVQIVFSTSIDFVNKDGVDDVVTAQRSFRELLRQHADEGSDLREVLLRIIEEELQK